MDKLKLEEPELAPESKRCRFLCLFAQYDKDTFIRLLEFSSAIYFHTSGVDNHFTRLRALTHRLNSDFSSYMRDNGQKRKIISDELDEDSEPIEPKEGQLLVTESEMREWVKEVRSKLLRLMNSF